MNMFGSTLNFVFGGWGLGVVGYVGSWVKGEAKFVVEFAAASS